MSERKEIKLSRATPRVKQKIYQLLARQDADLAYNEQTGFYEVDLKVTCGQKEVLDQIVQSMTETIDEKVSPNDYSFSRLLDPLEIYDNNIKAAEPPVDMELLKTKIDEDVSQAFQRLKERLVAKYDREHHRRITDTEGDQKPSTSNPEQVAINHQKFKSFLGKRLAAAKQETIEEDPHAPELFSGANSESHSKDRKKLAPVFIGSQPLSSSFKRLDIHPMGSRAP